MEPLTHTPHQPTHLPSAPSSGTTLATGGRLVGVEGRTLPLRSAALRVDVRGGLARVVLEQRFANPWPDPMHVTYRMPLPVDGAVSGYCFRVGDRRISGEVDRKQRARQRFEDALLEGRTAALLDEERPNLFTQEIGNIPPGAELVAELTIDQPLAWIEGEGAWEWRFPTSAAPRYLGAPGRVVDAEQVSIDVADRPLPVRLQLELRVRDLVTGGRRPESPSHAVRLVGEAGSGAGALVVFGDESGARLDRDVVVRWPVAEPRTGMTIDAVRPAGERGANAAYGLLTFVPPSLEARARAVPRDLILLLDTSGSMSGAPLDQARHVAGALVGTLGAADRLEMIEFGSDARRWKKKAVEASPGNKAAALAWLASLRASGGTEMKSGLMEALAPLGPESQRQIVIITDGQIGFEQEIVQTLLHRLPSGSRLHAVGVGSAVNRALTGPAARAGRGVEVVIGLGEDPERAARRLVARTSAPSLVELRIAGDAVIDHAPSRLPDVFAGAPVRVAVRLRPEGGVVRVGGRTAEGAWEQVVHIKPVEARGAEGGGSAVSSLWAREAVEDLEVRLAAGEPRASIDPQIEQLGLTHQISTRLTSWVAIDEQISVDPGAPTRRELMPQELPHGQSTEGLGLRAAALPSPLPSSPSYELQDAAMSLDRHVLRAAERPRAAAELLGMNRSRLVERIRGIEPASPPPAAPARPAPSASGAQGGAPPQKAKKDAAKESYELDDALMDMELAAPKSEVSRRQAMPVEEGVVHGMGTADGSGAPDAEGADPFAARVRSLRDKDSGVEIVIEMPVMVGLAFRRPVAVWLLLDGGGALLGTLASGTTREGGLVPGQVLRLVLHVPSTVSRQALGSVLLQMADGARWLLELAQG